MIPFFPSLLSPIFLFIALLSIVVCILIWRLSILQQRVNILLGGVHKKPLDAHEELLRRIIALEAQHNETKPRITRLEDQNSRSVQKVGFLRFNPFQDTGGDNSFILALLDQHNNGVIVSSLYSRDGTRIYAKKIEGGTTTHPLFEEEEKALSQILQPQKG